MAIKEIKDMGASVLTRLKKQTKETDKRNRNQLSDLFAAFCTGRVFTKT